MTGFDQLATLLKARGLSTAQAIDGLEVINPVAPRLVEVVTCVAGSYRTDWGYEVGEVGSEPSTVDRLAFLLGVPNSGERQ